MILHLLPTAEDKINQPKENTLMPFVRGFMSLWHPSRPELPSLPRPPGSPDIGLPEDEGDLDFWGGARPPRPGLPPDFEMPELPSLPPRDEWPPLPPLPPGSLPIPPNWGHPTVPLPPDPEVEPPPIWPPLPQLPELPDLGGKTLALVVIHVSRKVNYVRWMVIDHEEVKSKLQKFLDWLKAHAPAGGVGRPPARPTPGG